SPGSCVSSPSLVDAALYGVVATSANDVWAVGGWAAGFYQEYSRAFIEHWDGNAWTVFSSPTVNGGRLNAATVVSPNDVWAVGWCCGLGSNQTLTEHWDGSAWTLVTSPNPGATTNRLYGVNARSSND